ncbi:MAG: lipoprotein-releasing ABC transporter permease subunit [Phenylobacterium sp.]|uniref:lipoprotein-releasing ABC transporter permease subunit n=1 Tax=Phenylobacterium sp. TaxID=1871053 RepID=UPI001A5A4052|nr:lipoprotein-releasing ABC transporter permease subunit [Phenylobacterium sp.]MBL8770144.1 lipoprotein-releasing ABC transporter permease subunit [Phenylobacterium sp.]
MIAARYLRARRSQGGVSLISIISFLGIMLAVAGLIAIMSIMNGFRSELLNRILGFQGHLFVTGGVLDGPERDRAVARIVKVPGVVQAAPIIEAQAIAIGPSQITGTLVRGISLADLQATKLVSGQLTAGSLREFGKGEYGGDVIVVGARLAQSLGVAPGDTLTLISPTGGATAFGGTPLQKPYTVGATFSVGMSQYDQAYIYMPLAQAQLFFGREDTADAIEIKVTDPDHASRMRGPITKAAGPAAIVNDWTQRDVAFWGALAVERTAMRIILGVVIAIVALNIISGLVMLAKNKTRDVAILRTVGAGRGSVLRIFFMIGASIGAAGTVAGVALGVLFSLNIGPIQSLVEWATGAQVFASDVYYLSRLPAKVDWLEVFWISVFSLSMACLWSLIPAWRASKLDPVEALRYE